MQRTNISVVITHIASWLLFLSLPVIFITSQASNTSAVNILLLPEYWLCFIFFITLFYLHTYYLFPNLYRQQKKPLYFFSVVLLFIALVWLKPFDRLMNNELQPMHQQQNDIRKSGEDRPPPNGPFDNHQPPLSHGQGFPPPHNDTQPRTNKTRIDIVSIFMFIVAIAISISTDVSKRLQMAAEAAAKAETDKANAELSVLKAQVNPHFLFNTLNNIYSLALNGNENTAESILKLSNIMRYVTDDAPEDFVPLQKELDCISDFIALQKLRIGDKVALNYSINGSIFGRNIAPFILLTFVENMFKYGVSKTSAVPITIQLDVTEEGIRFFGSNSFSEIKKEDRKGTGIVNVKKRLAYLYADRHILNIATSNNLYTVQLFINDKV